MRRALFIGVCIMDLLEVAFMNLGLFSSKGAAIWKKKKNEKRFMYYKKIQQQNVENKR